MRRGFKAEAERLAIEIRGELRLGRCGRLDPFALAEHLAIPVHGLSSLPAEGASCFRHYFSSIDPDTFSAITVFIGKKRLIVHNDAHHPNRQASNLAHEISHTLLEHEPAALIGKNGDRFWDSTMEQEATWLGAALLVPRDGALQCARAGRSLEEIAEQFGVSIALCQWRIVQTGIAQQLNRARGIGY